ncbi:MAG: type II toxin-antitoxin system RelE/ParE family toxin [Methylococcaceae bacterium]|jgi:plasmid stabilization system protein ParE|nr:MAG: type II toxin-antitoxin system RelE/ParE family toxin [Methylococcaceae bacterium]
MQPYELTPSAEDDLKDIARYTLKQWDKKQSIQYAGLLEARFLEITTRSALSRTFSERYPQLQVTRCEHHYIFYIHPEGKRPCIIAVLHERMDKVARLKNRLD